MEVGTSIHSLCEDVRWIVAALPYQLPLWSIGYRFHWVPTRITNQFSCHIGISKSERICVAKAAPGAERADTCESTSTTIQTVRWVPVIDVDCLLDAHRPLVILLVWTFPGENRFRILLAVSHFHLIVRMKKLKQSGILTFQVDLNCIGKMPGFRIEYTCPDAVPYRKHDTASFNMRNKGSFNQQIYYLLLVILWNQQS